MIYTYPKVQTPTAGTIFLMAATFDSNKFTAYQIKYYGFKGVEIRTYSHPDLVKLLQENIAIRQRKQSFANYKEFIKIPLYA